jgi:hypothetical protein
MDEPNPVERGYLWCGVVGMLLVFVGLVAAHLFPPPTPSRTAEQFAAFYQQHTGSFRVGTVLMGFGGAMVTPWMAVIARRLNRIAGHGPATAWCFLGLGMLLMFQIVMPIALGQVAAFRPQRPAPDTEALNDLFFIQLISPAYLYVVQLVVTAVGILADRAVPSAFPRWIGYVNLWAALGAFPGVLVIFFHSGPWAWNGVFGFWIPAVVFGIWVVAMTIGALQPTSPAAQRQVSAGAGL